MRWRAVPISERRQLYQNILRGFGNDADVIRITADKPGQINLNVSIDRPERSTVGASSSGLEISGQLDNGTGGTGMRYYGLVKAKN